MAEAEEFPFDYFVSRCGAAAEIATEVASTLEDAGFRVKVQDYDFGRGGDFVGDIHDALVQARHLYILHTRDYDRNYWTRKEFTNFLAAVPASEQARRVCVLRCDDAAPRGILANVVFGDITGETDKDRRRSIILDVALGKALAKRADPPIFGGAMPGKNEGFVGREEILSRIGTIFGATESVTQLCVIAIVGLGGVGKSALVRSFIDRRGSGYAGIWWFVAESRTSLLAAFTALAARFDSRLENEPDAEKCAKAVLRRLERNERPFLLIFDNLSQHELLDDFLPARGAHVLVTTRLADWAGRAHEIDLSTMTEEEAVAFLQARAGRSDLQGARKLAHKLGYLPLALDHAAAYAKLAAISFDSYAQRAETLMAKAPKGAAYPSSIAATFSLAIDNAARETPAAETLIGYLAFLAPERIPASLSEVLLGGSDGEDALITLTGISLLQRDQGPDDELYVSLHRLVQAAMRARLVSQQKTNNVIGTLLRVLADVFPVDTYDDPAEWPRCDRLLPHALSLREHAKACGVSGMDFVALCDRAGEFLHARAAFPLAESLFRDAIEAGTALGDAAQSMLAKSQARLANLLRNAGRPAEAEPILRALLERLKDGKCDRLDHARTLTSLAGLLHETGRAAEAEPLLREAIALGEADLGRTDPEVAVRINNLARLLQDLGSLDEAEILFREAISAGEKSLGRNHVQVGDRLNNLAKLLHDRGRHAEAEALYREAIEAGTEILGTNHPALAVRNHNLANLLRDTGRLGEAEPIYRRSLSSLRESLGDAHPIVARVRRNLAILLLALGRCDEALSQASTAAIAHRQALGAQHPWTIDSEATIATARSACDAQNRPAPQV